MSSRAEKRRGAGQGAAEQRRGEGQGPRGDARRVDLLNIGLMLGSCALAFVVPFELFLFSYAVLGPLHYLTEISWLHKRQYFTERRADAWLLLPPLAALLAVRGGVIAADLKFWVPVLNALGLGVAIAVVATRDLRVRAGIVFAALLVGFSLVDVRAAHDALRLFLPTLIHVWLFTGAFVLFGALRGRSATGLASLAVFVACSVTCFVFDPALAAVDPESYVGSAYQAIASVNLVFAYWLGLTPMTTYGDVLGSETGRMVARFVAFAYTYHYLNWFSKTSIIQWHRIPRAWTFANIGIWIACVALYAWDYSLGLATLFALSYLHVYLELPLNARTFAGIGRELAARRPARGVSV